MKESKIKIHFFYITFILICLIIALVTIKWKEIPNIIDYMTFAMTIASILLATLAIVYAFFSNSSFTKNIVSLNDSSKIISDASKIISKSSSELNKKIGDIPIILDKIDKKTDHTINKLNELKLLPLSESENFDIEIKEYDDKVIHNLLHKISANGLKTLLFIKFSYNYKKQFNLESTSNHFDISKDYSYAFLMPLVSLGFLKYKEIENGDEFDWLVTELNGKIDSRLHDAIKDYNKLVFSDFKASIDDEYLVDLKIKIEEIEKYFK